MGYEDQGISRGGYLAMLSLQHLRSKGRIWIHTGKGWSSKEFDEAGEAEWKSNLSDEVRKEVNMFMG